MLSSGTKVGTYEVVALIGAGGMGEVYRAHDTRLNRDVALKVLLEVFARDRERMARFEREAKLLASLNHPNIAAIYGLEESGPIRALVMELVEGPTLAERIRSGPVPVDETLPIARQVAEAVEYAHDKNVIHRDLKPANIKVTSEGVVKVLDFGLAKALADEPSEADMSNSPTLSIAATRQGVILGTAAYMSPEQAKGKTADRRADVWAFGVVLCEMLTGKQVFTGETLPETLAAVMKEEPSFEALPSNTPPAIRKVLRRCLEKNVKRRLQHIGEARIIVEDVLSGAAPAETAAAGGKSRERLAWSVAALFCVAFLAALALGAFAYFGRTPEETKATRFFMSPPETWNLRQFPGGASPAPLAVSPDGQSVAFVATGADNRSLLWVRPLDTLAAQSLAGTEDAWSPFWSPDSRFLGFFADGKLKKIEVAGGPPITLCDAPNDNAGGTWSRDGVIVFDPGGASALQRVSAAGGVPSTATVLAQGDVRHQRPFFLPDGRHFLYEAEGATPGRSIYLASLDSTERKLLFNADASNVVFSQGHLLFLREATLMAQPFDTQRLELTGEAFPIAEQIQIRSRGEPHGNFSASENGVLAYQTGVAAGGSQLTWFDRTGKQIGVLGDRAGYGDVWLSPDGRRVSVSLPDQAARTRDIWVYDVARGLKTRFTFDPTTERAPIWSPDGARIVVNSNRKGNFDLYLKPASGAGTEEVLLEDNARNKYPMSWSADGRFFLYRITSPETGSDLFVLPLSGDRKPVPFLQTQFSEGGGQFSPDGGGLRTPRTNPAAMRCMSFPFRGLAGNGRFLPAAASTPSGRATARSSSISLPTTS